MLLTSRCSKLCWSLYHRPVKASRADYFCGKMLVSLSVSLRSLSTIKKKHGVVVMESSPRDTAKPVVTILGWNSSRDKHIAKYSSIFEDRGFDTVRVTANPFNTFLRSSTKVKEISEYLLDTLQSMGCHQRPVFLYAFSNGGCAMYFHMVEALTTKGNKYHNALPVIGSIFDSCPVNPSMESVKAVQETVTDAVQMPLLKPLVWYSLGAIIPLTINFNSTVKRFMNSLTNSPLVTPRLVLYSKTDKFAPYKDIDKFVDALRDRGIDVTQRCWEESAHVNHYREHTEEYLSLLNAFLDKCLDIYRKEQ